jgi:hypothetical protein
VELASAGRQGKKDAPGSLQGHELETTYELKALLTGKLPLPATIT